MMKAYLSLAIIVLVLHNPMNPCRAMSMRTNTSRTSSLIADDEELEFLMDSHSGRILAGTGDLGLGILSIVVNQLQIVGEVSLTNPAFPTKIQAARIQKILGFITVDTRTLRDLLPWMLKMNDELNCF
ncbi:hypothetical protein CXB51_017483 [Gossypium anomalum]|uniref:Uncharacterized protein n=1 Tax=Gossypium anomalum TaxID=47600 RepID=A0A8J5YSV1_9ROSI|nr:hypothetical protein CXB51_017483 [Gossypium anomalum]